MAACDSHLPGRCQHWRRSLPQAIKVRGGWLSSTQWPIARTSDTASRQVRSMAYVLEGSGLLAPCAAREAEQRPDAEGHARKSFPDGDACLPSARNGLPHPHHNLGPISIRRQPIHSELFATKKGAMEKGDLISRLISFARNYRPSMLICGKPKSEHGGLSLRY